MPANPAKLFTLGAVAALALTALTACEDKSAGTAPDSEAVSADLREMSAKIKMFSKPEPPDAGLEFGEEAGPFKRAATTDCDQEGETIEVYQDTTVLGGLGIGVDTTRMYTQAGTLVCGFDDEIAYDLSRSYYKNALYESWFQSRSDYPDFMALLAGETVQMKVSGTGRVHYFSDYDIEVKSLDIQGPFSLAGPITLTMKMTLGLDGDRYQAPLTLAPGVDLMSEEDPEPSQVVMSGPIQLSGSTVGWFELMGDDRVVIRDADRKIVESH
jgi:hypothetical protein